MGDEHQAERPPSSRITLLLALLALDVVAATAFGRVFRGHGTALRLVLAAGVCVLLAGALERQHVLVATLASAVGLVAAIGVIVYPETTLHLLPTPTTVRTVLRAWDSVGRAAAAEVAPALPLRPLVLAALAAVWAASFSSHALAARARSPFMGILPPAALVAFATLLMQDGPRPIYVLLFLLAVLMLLYADGIRRIQQWGPVTAWNRGRGARFAASTSSRGARRVAVACLAVALFLPGLLPGFRQPGLVDVHADVDVTAASIDPLVDIRPRLLQRRAIPLFSVRAEPEDQGFYWRTVGLEFFDGRRWVPSETAQEPENSGIPVGSGTILHSNRPSLGSVDPLSFEQVVTVSKLVDPWLPAAYDPIQVNAPGEIRYDPRTSTLMSPDGPTPGYSYTVTSSLVSPTSEELGAVDPVSGPQAAPYLQLPELPPIIAGTARLITEDQPTPYLKILAIQQYLRSFRYDLTVPPAEGVDDMVYFLTQSQAGYCQQFAGTMAVLLRSLGIPARVAVGFTPGVRRNGAWQVTTAESHAWVEVLFPRYGWLAFEPTPTRYNPGASSYALVQRAVVVEGADRDPGPCDIRTGFGPAQLICAQPDAGGTLPRRPGRRSAERGTTGSIETTGPALGRGWRDWIVPGGGALVVLLLLLIPLTKVVRRRLALTRARDPRQRILTRFRVMTEQAGDFGLGRHASETFWEYRTRLKERVRELDGDLDTLATLVGRAAYSESPMDPSESRMATTAARATVRQLRRSAGGPRRFLGWFRLDPSTLRRWTVG
jgi:transglutaminase-like putative cysteine protease